MIKLSRTEKGFKVYDYKNLMSCSFEILDESTIELCLMDYKPQRDNTILKFQPDKSERFTSYLNDFFADMPNECWIQGKRPDNSFTSIIFEKEEDSFSIESLGIDSDTTQIEVSLETDLDLFNRIKKLIEKTRVLPIIRDDFAFEDFSLYISNRDLWFSKQLFELRQLEDMFLLNVLNEFCYLERHRDEVPSESNLLGGLSYAKEHVKGLEYTIKEQRSLVEAEIQRKDETIRQLQLLPQK